MSAVKHYTRPASRPTCKCCGRPLKAQTITRWIAHELPEALKQDASAWPRTAAEAARLVGWSDYQKTKTGPRPLYELRPIVRRRMGLYPGTEVTNQTELVGVGEDTRDVVVLEIKRETGSFGPDGNGYFCTKECGFEYGLAIARKLAAIEADKARSS